MGCPTRVSRSSPDPSSRFVSRREPAGSKGRTWLRQRPWVEPRPSPRKPVAQPRAPEREGRDAPLPKPHGAPSPRVREIPEVGRAPWRPLGRPRGHKPRSRESGLRSDRRSPPEGRSSPGLPTRDKRRAAAETQRGTSKSTPSDTEVGPAPRSPLETTPRTQADNPTVYSVLMLPGLCPRGRSRGRLRGARQRTAGILGSCLGRAHGCARQRWSRGWVHGPMGRARGSAALSTQSSLVAGLCPRGRSRGTSSRPSSAELCSPRAWIRSWACLCGPSS